MNQDQQKVFAEAFGVKNSSGFLQAIDRAEADIFSDTPQDLIELIGYWNENGEISNRADMLKSSIESKLKEADPNRDSTLPLSFEDALRGARLLAAATTFLKQNRIWIPDSNHDANTVGNGVDAQKILVGWNAKQCRALLMRPIFDEAIYGAVRFHHPSVREYLTAQWLMELIKQGKSRRAVESLFFSERYGQELSISSMRSILAWLILWDEQLRDRTIRVSPEVLIQGGDPSALPTAIRQELLESFCKHYSRQESRHLSFDIAGVRRFAHPDLGQTINDLIARYAKNDALVKLLLRMIWQGEISDCADTVHRYALNANAWIYNRIYGIRALACVGNNEQKQSFIAAVVADGSLNDERIIDEVISAFSPEWLDTQGIITLLAGIEKPDRPPGTMLAHNLEEFVQQQCPLEELVHWVQGVAPLLKQEPVVEKRFHELSKRFGWLLSPAALAVEQLDDRLVALSLAFNIYATNGRGNARRRALWKSVRGEQDLEEALRDMLHPPAMTAEQKQLQRSNYGWKKRQQEREKGEKENRQNWIIWLQEHTETLRDTSIAGKGSVWNATQYLLGVLRDKSQDHGTWAQSNWRELIEEYGIDVAEAFRDGCINYWRKYVPEIRSEGMENSNNTSNAVIVGLSGFAMEASHVADWPKNLTEKEAQLASRYALRELNGFPDWLQQFHAVFPKALETRMLSEIEWELSTYEGEQPCYYVLSNIARIDWSLPRLTDSLLGMLSNYEPRHDQSVEDALNVVLSSPALDAAKFAQLAKRKVNANKELSRQALWLAAWTCVEAHRAVNQLASMLGGLDKGKATMLAMLYITRLLGDRHGSSLKSDYKDYKNVSILLALIKTMHTYIHHSEDIDRSGGEAYSPGLRDNAQDARDLLFRLLKEIPGKETYLAMMNLAKTHPNERARDWYAISARERAESDAEHQAWHAEDVVTFAKDAEKIPSSHRELFDLVLSRLDDLKLDLEEGDSSNAELLRNSKEERLHRIYIGGWLREQSRGRYNAPQEDELADRKKPDIRIECSPIDYPVPIELKVADNWSGTVLLERLQNQLCGQYLRDIRSNCGIFLLTYCGEKAHWKHPKTEEMLNFPGLVQALQKKADRIAASSSMVDSIEVVGIDLTKRNKKGIEF